MQNKIHSKKVIESFGYWLKQFNVSNSICIYVINTFISCFAIDDLAFLSDMDFVYMYLLRSYCSGPVL